MALPIIFSTVEIPDLGAGRFSLTSLIAITALLVLISSSVAYYHWWSNSPRYGANMGPKIYPLVGSFPEFLRNRNRRLDWVTGYIGKSPTLTIRTYAAHFGTQILTANPANVEHILKTKFDIYPKGEMMRQALSPLLGNGIFTSDGPLWKAHRKVANYEFSSKSLKNCFMDALQTETNGRLFPLLTKAAAEGSAVDLQDILIRFGFDVICLLFLGLDMGCLEISLPQVKFAESFGLAAELCLDLVVMPSFLTGNSRKRLNEAVKVVDDFVMSAITSRRRELSEAHETSRRLEEKESDFLSRIIQAGDQDLDAVGRSSEEIDVYIRDTIVNFILAGRDTSSSGLAYFFWVLAMHPEVETKIRNEVKAITELRSHEEKGKEGARFTNDELKQMQYLTASISETLRLYPSLPTDTKTCAAADVLPDGTRVRRGDRVSFHPFAMGRTESLWGKDCLQFKPERWLRGGLFVPESPYKFAAFQAGPRICSGKDLGLTQMKYVAASILSSQLKLNVLPGQTGHYSTALLLKMKDGLHCRVSPKLQS